MRTACCSAMYFVVALVTGQLTARVRAQERHERAAGGAGDGAVPPHPGPEPRRGPSTTASSRPCGRSRSCSRRGPRCSSARSETPEPDAAFRRLLHPVGQGARRRRLGLAQPQEGRPVHRHPALGRGLPRAAGPRGRGARRPRRAGRRRTPSSRLAQRDLIEGSPARSRCSSKASTCAPPASARSCWPNPRSSTAPCSTACPTSSRPRSPSSVRSPRTWPAADGATARQPGRGDAHGHAPADTGWSTTCSTRPGWSPARSGPGSTGATRPIWSTRPSTACRNPWPAIRSRSTCPTDMPPFRADSALMEQVIANLLLNAALHTPAGTPIFLAAGVEGARGAGVLHGRRPGAGLAAGDARALFQKFQRGDAARAGGPGPRPVDHPGLCRRPGRRGRRRAESRRRRAFLPFTCPTLPMVMFPANES